MCKRARVDYLISYQSGKSDDVYYSAPTMFMLNRRLGSYRCVLDLDTERQTDDEPPQNIS